MDIIFSSLHQIDHTLESKQLININDSGDLLSEYTDRLIEEITTSGNRRSFEFRSETTEVRAALSSILNDNERVLAAEINVDRLLTVEADAQEEFKHLGTEIPKGSLFQTLVSDNGTYKIIISKADHNEFIDDQDFRLHKGLPWKKRIFKAAMIVFGQENNVDSVYVYDTNNRISTYWWKHYFELKELYTDEHNTSRALDMIDKKIFGKTMKDKFPADHFQLRNSTVGFFQSSIEFEMDTYLGSVWENYEPVDDNFKVDKWIEKIRELPNTWNFDPRFEIVKSEVKKRKSSRFPLTTNLDLVVKDHLEHIEDTISAEEDVEGNKFIRIKTVAGYERFKRKDQ